MKKAILSIAVLALLSNCKKEKSCSEIFEESYEVNITSCMQPLIEAGVDSTKARRICACYMDNLFALDSTFIKKKSQEMILFVEQHADELEKRCK